jgi:hypothetical protein
MSDEALRRLNDGSAWDEFCDRLKATGHQVLAAAPDDPFDRAEGLRYVSRLARVFLRSTLEDADPARAALGGETPKIGLDNPDYVYRSARISPAFEYRLEGALGDAHLLGIGTFSGGIGTPQGLVRDAYVTSRELTLDADGRFSLAISRRWQPGDWLRMREGSNQLQIRQTLLERERQQPATLRLRRSDGGAAPAPLDPAHFARGLDLAGGITSGAISQFLGWTASFASHVHEIRELDPALGSFAQGDPNTRYFYGYWDLGEDDAFVVEFTPPECEYWNLQIGNHWLESLDYEHYRTHVNHQTAAREPDGSVRIVIARRDPGVANWLDTVGHARGALALRWVDAAEVPTARTRVAPIGELA